MQRVRWIVGGTFVLGGAAWLAELVWRGAHAGDGDVVPLAVGAVIGGLTMSRALGRRAVAITVASSLLLAALQAIALARLGIVAPWTTLTDAPSLFVFGTVTLVGATLGAIPRFPGRSDHRLLWLWVSGLITLGSMVSGLMLTMSQHDLTGAGVAIVFIAPVLAGALSQTLVARRMIWICGGGGVMFIVLILDQSLRTGETEGVIPAMLGSGIFILLGALGARIAWRVQHGVDHDLAPPELPELPEARAR